MSEKPHPRSRGVRLSALAVAAASSLVVVPFAAAPAQAADPVTIQLLNINDFHGAIPYVPSRDTVLPFATKIEQLKAAAPAGSTLLLSAGDNIGASQFVSDVQDDVPTLDILDALGVGASAAGNHEFDDGYADLAGRVSDRADFPFLGANVYEAGTQTPALDEYVVLEASGLRVGVIGAVTQETASLVSPGGISGIEFGDPVAAVNRVAVQLTDGDESNGEADVLVAEYHEGAPEGADVVTLDQAVAQSPVFASIVNETSAQVDAIFTAHTHKTYAWEAPLPGGQGTRPVVQTGSASENVGKVVLTIDPATGQVQSHTQENVARGTTVDRSLPVVAEVAEIVDAARAFAKPIGDRPVGTVSDDVTTAFAGGSYVDGVWTAGTRDDRASESALGNLVATALRDGVDEVGGADLGIVNPGGLRDELRFAGDTSDNPANTDGVVTFAESNAVLPFANSVFLVDLTGADLKTVLEQQWQRTRAGTVPSRAFLHLGLSDNVDVTYDASRPEGDRITSILVDGSPVLAGDTYTVSTFSFLAQGGDNFRGFLNGQARDVNLLDRNLFNSYLEEGVGATDYTERQVAISPTLPTEVDPGGQLSFTASSLGLTSQGAPEITEVEAYLVDGSDGDLLETFPVTERAAQVELTVPADATFGQEVLFFAGSTLLGSVAVSDVPQPPAKGSIGVGNSVKVAAPYRYGKVGGAKPFTVFFAGEDGKRVSGTTFVTARKVGTSQLTATAWSFRGTTTRMWTPNLTSAGSWQITVTFVPDDETYRPSVRSWFLWVTPTGR